MCVYKRAIYSSLVPRLPDLSTRKIGEPGDEARFIAPPLCSYCPLSSSNFDRKISPMFAGSIIADKNFDYEEVAVLSSGICYVIIGQTIVKPCSLLSI